MEILIWLGAAVSLAGMVGLIWCIVTVWKARKAGLNEEALRQAVQKVVPINTAALFLSVIGLMMVVIGILLS
jgi:heme exporter protein D